MRNAGPIGSPTDPFASVPLPTSGVSRRPRIEALPPGVSRDIFGPQDGQEPRPAAGQTGQSGQSGGAPPPVAPQPWPMKDKEPSPVFGPPPPPPPPSEPEPPRRRRLLPGLAALVAVLAVLAYVVPAMLMSGAVLRGTRVGGVDIGGLTVTQAADKLRAELAPKLAKPVVVEIGDKQDTVQPDEAGVELDVVGTIGEAPSGFPGPIEVWRGLTGTTDIKPRITVDASQLTRTVEGLAESVDKPAREGRVTFSGLTPKAREPEDGVLLDREDAVTRIGEAFLAGRGTVALNLRPAKPVSTPEGVRAAETRAKRAVSAPVTLTLGGRQAQLTPAVIAANLTYAPGDDGSLVPRFDAKAALATVENTLVDAAQQPRDATYAIVGGKPVLVPARKGRGIDADRFARDVLGVLESGTGRTVPVTLASVAPEVTTDQVRGLGIKEKVAEFSTTFDCCLPRVTNIQRMAQQLDGRIVRPGETLSLNEATGRRTAEDGYVVAGQFVGGRMVQIVGGGVSQFATAMYNAAFLGGFEQVQRTPMDYYSDRYPAGRDAALLYPSVDLKWRNDSEHGVLVKTSYTGTSVTVTLWGTKRYDRVEAVESERRDPTPFRSETSSAPGCVPSAGQQGFTVDVTRVFHQDGKVVKRDKKVTTKYRPQAQVTCTATGR
ncbi:VanW family protein [Nonomuraea pusilla]|uniref:VanW family protein n=1 Tax=Nonomuraea pusilla TaxID=46177 RepID=UPI00331C5B62